MAGAKFDSRASTEIVHEMWEKWAFIAAGAGITTLMRASVGDIVTQALWICLSISSTSACDLSCERLSAEGPRGGTLSRRPHQS